MSKTTIQDVAREAGTSASTVSRVLTGNAPVNSETRTAVEAAIERLGFHPSHAARSLRTRSTHTISLLINDITNPFYSAIAKGVEEEANRRGYSLILCNTNDDPARERQYLDVLRSKQVDGMIFGPTGYNIELIRSLITRMPLVLVDRMLEAISATAIVADNEGGAYSATNILIEKGHRRIGVLMWEEEISTLTERLSGVSQALTEIGLKVDPSLVLRVPRTNPKEIAGLVAQWLTEISPRPTVLFALNNQLGLGAMHAFHTMRVSVPGEMGLMVFDDLDIFELTNPPISAVAQPAFAMGRRAMQVLTRRIEHSGSATPTVTVMPTQVIMRGSV